MEHETTFNIIQILGLSISLVIQLMIGLMAYYKSRSDPNTGQMLKFMFFISLLTECSASVSSLIGHLTPESHKLYKYAWVTWIIVYFLFFIILFATLCLRLHVVFKGTIYEMSRNTIHLFVVFFFVLGLSLILMTVDEVLMFSGHQIGAIIPLFSGSSFFIVYIFGSFLSVRFFVKNLSELAKSKVPSQCDLTLSAEAVSLNSNQLKFINLSTKYILLFVFAILSTILSFVLLIIVSTEFDILFYSIDHSINLFCVYLQFGFAIGHYQKCCCCLDSCCRSMMTRRIKKAIHKKSLSPPTKPSQLNIVHVDSASKSESMDTHAV